MKSFLTLFIVFASVCLLPAQELFTLKSPNGKLRAEISIAASIQYKVMHEEDLMLDYSPISMTLQNGTQFGINSSLSSYSEKSVRQNLQAIVYKRSVIKDNYNELILEFENDFDLVFRVYDDGVAYRFISRKQSPFVVESEQAVFCFPVDAKAYVPYVQLKRNSLEEQFYTSFENRYEYVSLSQWDKERLAFSPLLVEGVNGKKVCLAEADLIDYPGMFLYPEDEKSLKGIFAPYPKETRQGGHNMLQDEVISRESYMAKYEKGNISFPWRIIMVAEEDKDLLDSDMVFKLASPPLPETDFSWIKPGKVAWDWWNAWNLHGVDFKTGINNETYKYYIDFASQYGIEYVILDEGWSVNLEADLYKVVPEIDLEDLIRYAEERSVGLILWAGYYAFNKDIEGLCRHYAQMGIKGFKVDFMDRDDQLMVHFHYRAAEIASRYQLLIDYHGTYKPTGLQRTFPNVINFEGVHGLEQMKWSDENTDQVTYDVTFPFIRMLAGPVDYTQGAMRNASKGNFCPVNSEAMSQGTRCRQLAEYVIFESPLNMLCDNPLNYQLENECTEFIAQIPTVWEQSVPLNGKVGEYITIARKKGNTWYIGSLTNWDARTLELDLSFLGDGDFEAEIFRDGINADRIGKDYKKEKIVIPADRKLMVNMAPGGGCAVKIFISMSSEKRLIKR